MGDGQTPWSTGLATCAVDTTTRQTVWRHPKPGRLALSPQGALYLVMNGGTAADSGIAAFNLR